MTEWWTWTGGRTNGLTLAECCNLAWAKAIRDYAYAKIHKHNYNFVSMSIALRLCVWNAFLCFSFVVFSRYACAIPTRYIHCILCPSWQSHIRLLKWQAIYHVTKYLNAFAVVLGFTFVVALIFLVRLGLNNCSMNTKELVFKESNDTYVFVNCHMSYKYIRNL